MKVIEGIGEAIMFLLIKRKEAGGRKMRTRRKKWKRRKTKRRKNGKTKRREIDGLGKAKYRKSNNKEDQKYKNLVQKKKCHKSNIDTNIG